MAKQSRGQQQVVERVMHEFKHGELESQGRKVENPRQAIAIALSEAGASNQQSDKENARRLKRTRAKERKGETAMQEKEGRGALDRKRSVRSSGGDGRTRAELYELAKKRDIPGRSTMSKAELARAVRG